jgi:alpha-glucosidase (family GH31 glycosyl hydrolase)
VQQRWLCVQLGTVIDSSAYTFGLGESTRSAMKLSEGTYTLWNRDAASAGFNSNLYGAHPFYLQLIDGAAHGVFLLNSNGMDVNVADDEIVFKVIGGVIDLYIFVGPTPADVIKQYQKVIGTPAMMPYWSLGFHNCKYGYTSIYEIEEVVANYAAAEIPLDTQWADIDYMEDYRDFTVDPTNFPQVSNA